VQLMPIAIVPLPNAFLPHLVRDVGPKTSVVMEDALIQTWRCVLRGPMAINCVDSKMERPMEFVEQFVMILLHTLVVAVPCTPFLMLPVDVSLRVVNDEKVKYIKCHF